MTVRVREITVKSGKAGVEVDRNLSRLVKRMVDESLPRIVKPMEKARDDVMDAAVDKWPTRTGKSKRGFRPTTVVNIAKSQVSAVLYNRVPYVFFIRYQLPFEPRRHAWTYLVTGPAKRRGKKLAEQIGGDLVKLAGKG
jgi:hypothetical protein